MLQVPKENRLLAALPEANLNAMLPSLEPVAMPLGLSLYESGAPQGYVYYQQLCRWLLLSMDRLRSNRLVMTQELIANMLGVRREGVTEAAGQLQAEGLIEYSRGEIKVIDRLRLGQRVCECYAVVKKEYDRLLP
jgi:CRP-like cAMP-binding protein